MFNFIKFLLLGTITYSINIGVTYILIEYVIISANLAYIISLSIVTTINFLTSLKLIFKKKFSYIILQKYIIFLFSFSIINYTLVMYFKKYFTNVDFYFVIFVITTLIFFIKFFIYDKFVFKYKKI